MLKYNVQATYDTCAPLTAVRVHSEHSFNRAVCRHRCVSSVCWTVHTWCVSLCAGPTHLWERVFLIHVSTLPILKPSILGVCWKPLVQSTCLFVRKTLCGGDPSVGGQPQNWQYGDNRAATAGQQDCEWSLFSTVFHFFPSAHTHYLGNK